MKKLAFITSTEDPELISDDRSVFPALEKLGFSVAPLIWDRDPDLSSFDALIFRSCWNYHRKYDEFVDWLKKIESAGIPVLNPVNISRWNLNKKYLLELNVPIPKTQLILKRQASWKLEVDSSELVIKPAVSLNGHDTYRVKSTDDFKDIVEKLKQERDVLIQEYLPEIKTEGEISLIYFGNKFSHAIRKHAARDEFRIHSEYGGTREKFTPSADLIRQADAIVASVKKDLLFCRVDVVMRGETALLIELEIIDPMLHFGASENASQLFADTLARFLKNP